MTDNKPLDDCFRPGQSLLAHAAAVHLPEAMAALKKVAWEGTDHWDDLLCKRAEISGRLVVSSFTKEAFSKLKSNA